MVGSVAGDGGRSAAGEVVTRGTCASGDDGSWRWPDIPKIAVQRSTEQEVHVHSRSLSARRGPILGAKKFSRLLWKGSGRQASEEAREHCYSQYFMIMWDSIFRIL